MRAPPAAYAEIQARGNRAPQWLLMLTRSTWLPAYSIAFATHRVVGAPIDPIYQMRPPGTVTSEINFLAGSARVGALTIPIFGQLDGRDIMSRFWPGIRGLRAILYQGFGSRGSRREGLGFGDWPIIWRGVVAGASKETTGAGWKLQCDDLLRSFKRRIAGPLELDPITMALTIMTTSADGLNGPYDNGSLSGDRLPYAMGIDQDDVDIVEWESVRDQLIVERRLWETDHTGDSEIRPLAYLSSRSETSGLSWIVSNLLVPLGLAMRIKADGRIGVVSIMPARPFPEDGVADDSDFIMVAGGGRTPKLPGIETTDYLISQGFSGSIEATTAKAEVSIGTEIETIRAEGLMENPSAEEVNGGAVTTASGLSLSAMRDDVGVWKATAIETAAIRLRRHSAPQVKFVPRMQARRAANIETGDVILVSSKVVPPLGYPDPMSYVPMRVEKVAHGLEAGTVRATMRDWRENIAYPYELNEETVHYASDETPGIDAAEAELWDPMSDLAAPFTAQIPAAKTPLAAHYIVVRFVVKLLGALGETRRYDWGFSVGYEEVGVFRVSRDVQRYREHAVLSDVAAVFRMVKVILWAGGERMQVSGLFNRAPLRILAWQDETRFPPQVLTVTTQNTTGITHRWGADTEQPKTPPMPDIPVVCPTDAVPRQPSDQ